MIKNLVIFFDKKNEQCIRAKYSTKLQDLREIMESHGVEFFWKFVEGNCGDAKAAGAVADGLSFANWKDSIYLVDDSANLDVLKLYGYYAVALIHEFNRDIEFKNARYIIEGLDGIDYCYLEKVYKRLAGLPWEILETKRLKVRESTVEDVEDFYRIYKEPSITYYMENLHADVDEERAYVKDYIRHVYGLYGYGMWTVILKETGEVIGRAGISVRDGYETPELGFMIESVHQGKGYASEVCGDILKYAFEELEMDRIQALVCELNEGSKRVLKRLGFDYYEDVTEEGKKYQLWVKSLSE